MTYEWESEQIDNLLKEPEPEPQFHTGFGFGNSNEPDSVDDLMNEAERRFEVAQYYKLLLQDNLFENKTEASERVEDEIRAFIRERLSVLLGIRQPKTSNSEAFTDEQVAVLRDLADLGSEASNVLGAVMGRLAKKIDKKIAKPKEEPPQLRQVKEPPKPALKKRPEPKPKEAVAPRQAPRQEREPQKRNFGKVRVPEKYQDDPTLKIEGNKVFVQNRNEQGEHLWEKIDGKLRPLYKDVTPPVTIDVPPVKIPTGQALEMTMQHSAQRALQEANSGDSMIANQLINS